MSVWFLLMVTSFGLEQFLAVFLRQKEERIPLPMIPRQRPGRLDCKVQGFPLFPYFLWGFEAWTHSLFFLGFARKKDDVSQSHPNSGTKIHPLGLFFCRQGRREGHASQGAFGVVILTVPGWGDETKTD